MALFVVRTSDVGMTVSVVTPDLGIDFFVFVLTPDLGLNLADFGYHPSRAQELFGYCGRDQ
jgi:hypothetical protein